MFRMKVFFGYTYQLLSVCFSVAHGIRLHHEADNGHMKYALLEHGSVRHLSIFPIRLVFLLAVVISKKH